MSAATFSILLVEDDENDVRITQRAITKSGFSGELVVVRDGQQALDCLHGRGPWEQTRRPGLVLLDISLPKINGIDVLRTLKSDGALRRIPVLMLTTSSRQEDVAAAYAHGASGFVCKPIQFTRFVQVVRDLTAYWRTLARVPR